MKVPATKPYFSSEDIKFISDKFTEILEGKSFLTMFKYGEEFERNFANYIGTKDAVACNSGTSALELITRGLDLDGKEVILPSNTFVATANAVINAGGIPIFADCGEDMCLDPNDVKKKINKNTGAVVTVHIGGIVSEKIPELQKICLDHNIYLIEDAAQAHGSSFMGKKAGTFGVAAGFSFFSTKVLTTGEGGMVTTNDLALAKKMRSLREFGKEKNGVYINYYTALGYNWRLPEVASLMGIRQLASIDLFLAGRREIAKIYDEELASNNEIIFVDPPNKQEHNYFKYILLLKNHDRELLHKKLEEKEIYLSGYVYELPLHKQPVFPKNNQETLLVSERVCATHICLPIFYGMSTDQAKYVAKTLNEVLKEVRK